MKRSQSPSPPADALRQQAEKSLHKYTELFDFAPVGYFLLDPSGLIREANLAGATLLGCDRSQVINQSFERFVAPDCRQQFAAFGAGLRESNSKQSCELTLLKQGQGSCYVLIEAVVVSGLPGDRMRFLLAATDLSVRRQAEKALQAVSANLERAVEERTAELQRANAWLTQRIKQRERAEEEALERLRFEAFLADLSARFVGLPAEELDREINEAQRRICQTLELDRSTLIKFRGPDGEAVIAHSWAGEGFEANPLLPIENLFPWGVSRIRSGQIIQFTSVDELPAEAATDKETFRRLGPKSNVTFPLSVGGEVLGGLAFGALKAERQWPENLVTRLRLVAEVFASALARRSVVLALRESEERFRLLVEQAPEAVMVYDVEQDRVLQVNAQAERLFGRSRQELLATGLQGFYTPEQPDGQPLAQTVRANNERALRGETMVFERAICNASGQRLQCEVRLVRLPAGERKLIRGSFIDITERMLAEEALARSFTEIAHLKERLEAENVSLRQDLQLFQGHPQNLSRSTALRHVLAQAEQVAPTDTSVLLLGETGTGKELIASAIHDLGPRRDRPMVRVNCAAIPQTLIESELFGREKGAYTGALTKQIGRFEAAHRSTLFLDEIGELPPEVQVKLLRVLQEKQIERLGNPKPIPLDVRIITATNRDLERAVHDGHFRKDLYYRLSVFPITLPPLRDRREDIPLLVQEFVKEFANAMGKTITSIPQSNLDALQRYSWPGNVRELRNVIERAVILARGSKLTIELPASAAPSTTARPVAMKDVEREHILNVLKQTAWRVQGKGGAAEILGLNRSTLESRMAKLGIRRPER